MRKFLMFAAWFLSGCAFTTMLPAQKLAKGETVLQVSLEEPGFLIIPRLSGQATFGTGSADFSAHLGTTIANVNAGGTARAYLGNWALSLQGDFVITTFEENLFSTGRRFGFVTANARFGRLLVNESDRFYGGFQALAIVPFNIEQGADLPSGVGFAGGGYFGYAWDSPGDFDVQFEVAAAPLGLFPGVYTEDEFTYGVGLAPIAQIGIAVQYRKERSAAAPPSHRSADPEPLR